MLDLGVTRKNEFLRSMGDINHLIKGTKMRRMFYLFLVAILLPTIGFGEESKSEENWTISPIQRHVLNSEILGRNIRLQIGLPELYETTDTSYAVLYYPDAFVRIGRVTETVGALWSGKEIPPLITVGIDIEANTLEEWSKQRSYILTPSKSDIYEKDFGVLESWTGGGPLFLECLEKEIIPFVENEYRTIPNDRALFGHSFGGLFALYALFEKPHLFNRYLVSSPSLPWDERVIFKMESEYAKTHTELLAKLFISVGSLENLPYNMMVHHMEELAEILRLRKYTGLDIFSIVFEGESHASVTPIAINKGLRVLYSSDMGASGEDQQK